MVQQQPEVVQQQPEVVQQQPEVVQQPRHRGGRSSAPLPGLPPQLVEEQHEVRALEQQPLMPEQPAVGQQQPAIRIDEQAVGGQQVQQHIDAQDDDDSIENLLDGVPNRESFFNQGGGKPNRANEDESDFGDYEQELSERGPKRRYSRFSGEESSSVDSGEMNAIDDDDDVVSMDGYIVSGARKGQDSKEMNAIDDDDDVVSMDGQKVSRSRKRQSM